MAKQSLRSNFFYNVSYELFRIIVPLITTPYISRILWAEGVGAYTLAHTYSQYFILFAGFGFSTYAARQLAYERDDIKSFRNTFWEIFLLRGILMLFAIAFYIVVFFVCNAGKDISYQICIIYLIAALFDFSYYYRAIENFKTITIRNLLIKGASLILIFLLIRKPSQVWLYTLILAGSELIGQAIMIISLDRSLFAKPEIEATRLKKHFKESFTLFIPALAIQVYGMLDKLMLGSMVGESSVGYYENAQKMVRLASTIPLAIVAVSTTHVAYDYARGNIDAIRHHFSKVFKFVSFLAFPMCFGLIAVARNFSSWFYGPNFTGIESLVMAGAVLIISLAWSGLLGNMILISSGNQKYYTIGVYTGAALNFCMNAILIPKIGAMGALLASDVAEVSGMILMFYFSNRIFKIGSNIKYSILYFLSSVVMCIVILFVERHLKFGIVSTIIEIISGSIVYICIMLIMKDDCIRELVDMVRKLWQKIASKRSRS